MVFDKTGTLTLGAPEPLDLGAHDADDLRVALALAQGSSHPLAQALAQGALALGVRPAHVTEIREVPGHGIEGVWQERRVRLGRADWVGAEAGDVTATTLRIGGARARDLRLRGRAAAGGRGAGRGAGGPRDGAAPRLGRRGRARWRGWPSGSASPPGRRARGPRRRRPMSGRWRRRGRKVLMVGDGLNDTAALAEALVSVSPASALDAARAASDIVLLGRDIAPVEDALRICRQAVRRMRENFCAVGGLQRRVGAHRADGARDAAPCGAGHVGLLRDGDAQRATSEVTWTS